MYLFYVLYMYILTTLREICFTSRFTVHTCTCRIADTMYAFNYLQLFVVYRFVHLIFKSHYKL